MDGSHGLGYLQCATAIHSFIAEMIVTNHHRRTEIGKDLTGGSKHFFETCGLPISTYFSATKISGWTENVDGVKKAIQAVMVLALVVHH
ncbi:Glycerol kinase [Platanthera guangdongensis]|uniref:Glycerol kinase n=1 Tax=Platanthera guangdongensis TaxID=2320717 RepID=A0ABR2LUK8_9ASPA